MGDLGQGQVLVSIAKNPEICQYHAPTPFLIAPSEEKFYPAMESLRWREKSLTGSYA
jgi:hypothetical protein